MPKIRYMDSRTIDAVEGQTILEAAIAAKMPHMSECGGNARCTTCRVQIVDGLSTVGLRTPAEEAVGARKGWGDDTRLACQTKVLGDVAIRPLVQHRSDVFTFNLEESDQPAGKEQHLAVMFCDLRNFTGISEGMLPHDIMYIVNSYATECSEAILQNDGFIDKYMGDGIMAVFGLSDNQPGRICRNAVRAGLNIQDTAARLTKRLGDDFQLDFQIGVGIHYGPCVVGLVGHPSHRSFSLLGDTVNAAARIEAMTKNFEANLLISSAVFDQAPNAFVVEPSQDVPLRGKDELIKLYPVTGLAEDNTLLLVQQSLADILPHRREVGLHFYQLLFERYPDYRPLFPDDLDAQSVTLMNMIEATVVNAARPGDSLSGLRELGRRHAHYGVVKNESFDHVGECIIQALSDLLGPRLTPELKEAWEAVYGTVANAVSDGMELAKP